MLRPAAVAAQGRRLASTTTTATAATATASGRRGVSRVWLTLVFAGSAAVSGTVVLAHSNEKFRRACRERISDADKYLAVVDRTVLALHDGWRRLVDTTAHTVQPARPTTAAAAKKPAAPRPLPVLADASLQRVAALLLQREDVAEGVRDEVEAILVLLDASLTRLDQERLSAAQEAAAQRQHADALQQSWQQRYDQELAALRQTLEASHHQEMEQALADVHGQIRRELRRHVGLVVDRERAGRLRRIEHVEMMLKLLREKTMDALAAGARARDALRVRTALDTLAQRVHAGAHTPFVQEWESVRRVVADSGASAVARVVVETVAPTVPAAGVSTAQELASRFEQVRSEVRKAALVPDHGGFLSHLVSRVVSTALFRDANADDPVDGVLIRAQSCLARGDVDMATREMSQLSGWAAVLARDWIAEARRHLELQQALAAMDAECVLLSTRV